MAFRSYKPKYSKLASIAIQNHKTRHKYCIDYKKTLPNNDYRYWFAIYNDQPYDRRDGKECDMEHIVFFEKREVDEQEKRLEIWSIILRYEALWYAVLINPLKEKSVKHIRHVHLLKKNPPRIV